MKKSRGRGSVAWWEGRCRGEFVLRPMRRPGSICEEVEENSVRMAREAREAWRTWRPTVARP